MGLGYQNAFTAVWNRIAIRRRRRRGGEKLNLGLDTSSGYRRTVGLPIGVRTEHIAILGKTGSGKTSLLRHLCQQDIKAGHGFAFFDLHGDTTPFLLAAIAEEERRRGVDLASRTLLIDPSDRERSVGINILEALDEHDAFVEIAETVQILKHRWKLDVLGVRTDELLRHTLFVLTQNRLTFLEISPFLTSASFREECLAKLPRTESRNYFDVRYNLLSPQMQAVYREAILNKVSVYTADPHFRHLLGQRKSTVNLKRAIDSGCFVLFRLEKGRLGEETATLAALLLAKLKHAILGRQTRRLFTLYCDELQNLVAYDSGLDVLLSEARKFGVSVVSANQYLDQFSTAMRAAVLAMGSHVFFALSGLDAARTAYWFGRGGSLAERLRTLPKRHAVTRLKDEPFSELVVPAVEPGRKAPEKFLTRVIERVTVARALIENEIRARHATAHGERDDLSEEWS